MRAIVVALMLGGCYSPSAPTGAPCAANNACPSGQACVAGFCTGDGTSVDGMQSGSADASACSLWSAKHFDACAIPAPMGDLHLTQSLSGYSWDTDSGALRGRMNTPVPVATMTLSQVGGSDVLLASVQNLTIDANATLSASGSRPLLIAVWGTATIAGDIDVSGTTTVAGPGAPLATECTSGAGTAGTPATGGGGGSFQGDGGQGGNTGGAGGSPQAVSSILRGGCSGNVGGAGSSTQASRGAGGGALQITARVAISVAGTINAGGGGGTGGRANYGGGGGGGAGGFIGLDAPTVSIAGVLAANGGAGGGGASDVASGVTGGGGTASATPANGGAGATTSNVGVCGKGGNGSAGATLTGQSGATSACGGGGGGGAAGYIVVWSAMPSLTGTVSPPATSGP